jgi:hypothetical protein
MRDARMRGAGSIAPRGDSNKPAFRTGLDEMTPTGRQGRLPPPNPDLRHQVADRVARHAGEADVEPLEL